jgi:hypothetical protein
MIYILVLYIAGYRDDQLDRPPSNDPETVKRRQVAVPMLIQCDKCLKWRRLPYAGNAAPLTQAQLESWRCSDNNDLLNNTYAPNESNVIYVEHFLDVQQLKSLRLCQKVN